MYIFVFAFLYHVNQISNTFLLVLCYLTSWKDIADFDGKFHPCSHFYFLGKQSDFFLSIGLTCVFEARSPCGVVIHEMDIDIVVNWITITRKKANTYAGHTETLDSCFEFIRSHQQYIPWSPPLEIEPTIAKPKLYNWANSPYSSQVRPN